MFIISPALWGLAKAGAMGSSMIPMAEAEPYDVSQIRSGPVKPVFFILF